jgi:hypothetical protein
VSEKTSIRAPLPGQPKKDADPVAAPAPRISQTLTERPTSSPAPSPTSSTTMPTPATGRVVAPLVMSEPPAAPIGPAEDDGEGPDVEDLARRLVALAGRETFAALVANPRLRVPLPDADDDDTVPSPESWVGGVLRSFMTVEGLDQLQSGLRHSLGAIQRRADEEAALRQRAEADLVERDQKILALERRLSDTNVQQHRAKEALHRTLPIMPLIEQTFGSDARAVDVRSTLRGALDQPSEVLGPFVAGFCLGWIEVRLGLADGGGEVDETARVERAGAALRSLLVRLSGLYVPERREILHSVGAYVSAYFLEHDFVSPEDWRNVDPAVHNAGGVGGHSIKEGVSFAVLRRGNRQTVLHADILAE